MLDMNDFSLNLSKIVCLLFAGFISVCCVDLPMAVLGVFQNESSSSAVAAELAVTNFNSEPSWHTKFSYKNYDLMLSMTEDDLVDKIVIAETADYCQVIAEYLPESSILICYSTPNFHGAFPNVYFTQPNPKAIAPAVAYFIKYIDNYLVTSCDYDKPVEILIIADRSPYYPIANDISSILLAVKNVVRILHPEEMQNLSLNTSQVYLIVIVPSTPKVALNALMSLESKMTLGSSATVILQDVFKKRLLLDEISKSKFTTFDRYFFFDCPAWNINTSAYVKVRPVLNSLTNQILDEDDDAPLVYDSVWAIIQAVNRSRVEIEMGGNSGQSQNHSGIVKKKLREPTIGLSGEFSFDGNVRSVKNSVFKIYYSVKGKNTEIGKYYNNNNTISWGTNRLFEKDLSCHSNTLQPIPTDETPNQPNAPDRSVPNSSFRVTTKILTLMYVLMSLAILMY